MLVENKGSSEGSEVICEEITELCSFLESWDMKYIKQLGKINLFDRKANTSYNVAQKEMFVRFFYHIRGKFYKFLWFIGNHATSEEVKEQVLHNIKEEFGGKSYSHEQLYFKFSKSLGFEIEDEFIYEKSNVPFIKEFNFRHIEWLNTGSIITRWATFSAYERLDNIDYENLLELAKGLGASGTGLEFFAVHNKADHFDRTCEILKKFWGENKVEVMRSFDFIAENQILMWKCLSDSIVSLGS
jgi:hypothetical protein